MHQLSASACLYNGQMSLPRYHFKIAVVMSVTTSYRLPFFLRCPCFCLHLLLFTVAQGRPYDLCLSWNTHRRLNNGCFLAVQAHCGGLGNSLIDPWPSLSQIPKSEILPEPDSILLCPGDPECLWCPHQYRSYSHWSGTWKYQMMCCGGVDAEADRL
jgi:hypothetical protein